MDWEKSKAVLVVFRQGIQVHDVKSTSFARTVRVTVAFAKHCEELHFLALGKRLIKFRKCALEGGAQMLIRVVPTQNEDIHRDF